MVKDKAIAAAVSRIQQRSERQDEEKLLGTFVDVGILPQLSNLNHQIFYGRRGTGKTHVLKVLGSDLHREQANATVYIDARTLGSSTQFTDTDEPMRIRCLALFRDIFGLICNGLLEQIVEHPTKDADAAMEALANLQTSFLQPVETVSQESISTTSSVEAGTEQSRGASVGIDAKGSLAMKAGAHQGSAQSSRHSVSTTLRVVSEDKVIFPAVNFHLSRVLELADTTLFVLIDEWSSLPQDIQPYLSEFLKRSILPIKRAVVKIAALEQRSRFEMTGDRGPIGFELGADIAVTQDLDDYYVFDRNPEQIVTTYADMLLRHLQSELSEGFLLSEYNVSDGDRLVTALFSDGETFRELARAAEGVVRDLINIFTRAYFDAQRRGSSSIGHRAIREAARQWFEQDKQLHLDERLRTVLQRIVTEVIGNRHARSFLMRKELERHAIVQQLFDARVLHLMQRGYADKDNPGERYNIYTLDYGTYVDLIASAKHPQLYLAEETDEPNGIVPFDDKRSIRRIVLDERVLEGL